MESGAGKRGRRPTHPIEKTDEQPYEDCREHFVTGDLLCFRGRGLTSWAIRWLTRSWYSHVGLVYLHQDRRYCIEAVGKGVRIILMSELKKRYKGGIDYFSIPDADAPTKDNAIGFSFAQLGKLYDRVGIWRFFKAIVFGKVKAARDDEQWFCSELVAAAYKKNGFDLVEQSPADYTSPHDLSVSPKVDYRFSIKPED